MERSWAQRSFFWRCVPEPRTPNLLCCSRLLQCCKAWWPPEPSAAGAEICCVQVPAGVTACSGLPFPAVLPWIFQMILIDDPYYVYGSG